jgi:SAM-dependent methyltransferase
LGTGDLAVIIPTRDRWPILARTLEALRPQAGDAQIIVVVDGTDQDVPELAGVRTEVVGHGGPGAARNRGVAVSDRPLVLFLGDDMIPDPGLIDAHLARHQREPDSSVAVLGRIAWHRECRADPLQDWLERSGMQFDFDGISPGGDAGWGRFYSSNVSLKKELFDRAGGFDPDFRYYYEDLDLAWRLDRTGMVLRFEPGATTQHLHLYDVAKLQRRFAGVAVGEFLMQQKHPGFEPYFARRFQAALEAEPVARWWASLAGLKWPPPISERVRVRSDAYFRRAMAIAFSESWQGQLDVAELRDYLGDDYDEGLLRDHRAQVETEEAGAPDPDTFYRTSRAYLYDLTAFGLWPTKGPYREAVRRYADHGARLLDYGCGTGADGLRLAAEGYDVSFADFDNPSTRFLRWRLARRHLDLAVHDIDDDVPGGFDLAYSFDVIEHVEDPFAFLDGLEARAATVVVNLLEPDPADTHLHRALPIEAIVGRARGLGLLHHGFHHGRSHLLVYRGRG